MACYEKDCHYVMTHDGGCFYEGLPMDRKENCPMYKAKTNADRIRAMTDEDLAMLLQPGCPSRVCRDSPPHDCYNCWLDWLKQEAKDD